MLYAIDVGQIKLVITLCSYTIGYVAIHILEQNTSSAVVNVSVGHVTCGVGEAFVSTSCVVV